MLIAFSAVLISLTSCNLNQILLPNNKGIIGPAGSTEFAVILSEKGKSRVDFISSVDGSVRSTYRIRSQDDVVGITSAGSLALRPNDSIVTVPNDRKYFVSSSCHILQVAGESYLERDFLKDRYIARGLFGIRIFTAPMGRGIIYSLSDSSPFIVSFDASKPNELQIRDLVRNKVRSVKINESVAHRFQEPELFFSGKDKVYYYSESASPNTSIDFPTLRERNSREGEFYYDRYLVEFDLGNGKSTVIAKVQTAGLNPINLVRLGLSPKAAGKDIVVLNQQIILRANTSIFILKRKY